LAEVKRATTDETEALKLLADEIEEFQGRTPTGTGLLGPFAEEFIEANPGEVTERWLHDTELRLTKAVEFFGKRRELRTITPSHVREWLTRDLSDLAGSTQRHYLHALSGLYRYAQELGAVPVGYNPVSGLYRKPKATKKRQRTEEFFEIDEAARFLDAAVRRKAYPEVFATFLLTGGRRSEVFGLLVGDIDFDNGLVRIQPNEHRGLKRAWSERVVPLWPQLREFLAPYIDAHDGGPNALLFPGRREGMLTDLRKPLGEISTHLKIPVPRLTKFRHTYATARLQTTDNGKQISVWTVAKELGHKTVARVEDTYGHPNHYRPRGEVVEYRVKKK
jgi:integrase